MAWRPQNRARIEQLKDLLYEAGDDVAFDRYFQAATGTEDRADDMLDRTIGTDPDPCHDIAPETLTSQLKVPLGIGTAVISPCGSAADC